jgi:hypothetical protein
MALFAPGDSLDDVLSTTHETFIADGLTALLPGILGRAVVSNTPDQQTRERDHRHQSSPQQSNGLCGSHHSSKLLSFSAIVSNRNFAAPYLVPVSACRAKSSAPGSHLADPVLHIHSPVADRGARFLAGNRGEQHSEPDSEADAAKEACGGCYPVAAASQSVIGVMQTIRCVFVAPSHPIPDLLGVVPHLVSQGRPQFRICEEESPFHREPCPIFCSAWSSERTHVILL